MTGRTLDRPATPMSVPGAHASDRWSDGRLPGLMLFLLAAQFMTVIMLAAGMAPGYDIGGGAISDLGAIPETAALFNFSLITVGVLNILAGALLYRIRGGLGALSIFVLAGVGAVGAGAIPLGTSEMHSLFALVAFVGSTPRRSQRAGSSMGRCGRSRSCPAWSAWSSSSSWSSAMPAMRPRSARSDTAARSG